MEGIKDYIDFLTSYCYTDRMQREQRLERIRSYVKEHKLATIQEIADLLAVSHMTVRRDLTTLSPFDVLKTIHGGVIYQDEELPVHNDRYTLLQARTSMLEEKRRIARKAVSLLEPDDVIIIDAGSTGELIASMLPEDMPLTVICYALNIAMAISKKTQCSLIVTGGFFHESSMILESDEGLALLKQQRANKAFITASGVNLSLGVTCSNFFERSTKQTALLAAGTRILVTDSTKFGVVKSGHFADIGDFDIIITDSGVADREIAPLRSSSDIELHVV